MNGWVFDPFVSVGPTAIAALMHKRRAMGAEIKPGYLAAARERLHLAEKGELRVRPMERPVYQPGSKGNSTPPKIVDLDAETQQRSLFK